MNDDKDLEHYILDFESRYVKIGLLERDEQVIVYELIRRKHLEPNYKEYTPEDPKEFYEELKAKYDKEYDKYLKSKRDK